MDLYAYHSHPSKLDHFKDRFFLGTDNLDDLPKNTSKEEALIHLRNNPELLGTYAQYHVDGRWPEAEKYIIKSPFSSYVYAKRNLKEPWPEAEPSILTSISTAIWYAIEVLQRRWPELEEIISKEPREPHSWARYENHFMQ